jgi:hypothetical protein
MFITTKNKLKGNKMTKKIKDRQDLIEVLKNRSGDFNTDNEQIKAAEVIMEENKEALEAMADNNDYDVVCDQGAYEFPVITVDNDASLNIEKVTIVNELIEDLDKPVPEIRQEFSANLHRKNPHTETFTACARLRRYGKHRYD